MTILNAQFSAHRIQFEYSKTEVKRSVDPQRARVDGDSVTWMPEVRRGDYKSLNVYIVDTISTEQGPALGVCTLPVAKADQASVLPYDNCMVVHTALPGGGLKSYDSGKILVHEVGHWLNLEHTFNNGCKEPGDYVSDTPAEAPWQDDEDRGCIASTPRNTCIEAVNDKPDPVDNHMDYSNDACRVKFTLGQG
jgi:hypothetical protein